MNVLVLAPGGLEQTVLALALPAALRERLGAQRIEWVADAAGAALLQRVGGIDEVVALDRAVWNHPSRLRRWRYRLHLARQFVGRRYDRVLLLEESRPARVLARLVRAQRRLRFGHGRDRVRPPVPGRHLADEWLRLATGDDGPAMARAELPSLWLDPARPLAARLEGEGALVCLAPASALRAGDEVALRHWPPSAWRTLAGGLRKAGVRVAVVGPADEGSPARALSELDVTDLTGGLEPLEIVAVFSRADCVVAVDGDFVQLAVLAGAPLVGLFGPRPPWRVLRRDVHTLALWGGPELACRPCFDGERYARCPGNRCLQQLEPRRVLDAVLRRLGIERDARSISH